MSWLTLPLGITLVRTDPVTHPNDVGRAVAELSAADWDLLILNVINWIDVRAAAARTF